MNSVKRAIINLEGVVQGVGFRPFVHRISTRFRLSGQVCNTSYGVEIEIEGRKIDIKNFYRCLQDEVPPLAKITRASIKFFLKKGYKSFSIKKSKTNAKLSALISPDIGTCDECKKELFNPNDPRYLYPFINCTNCGPRFSIIKNLPYDRKYSTMQGFKLCPRCHNEFRDINNRRYHAQPNACFACGPNIELLKNNAQKISKGIPAINNAIELLSQGKIIAIKGLGGFHIACNAQNISAIKRLRALKNRPDKPLAIMVGNIETANKLCHLSVLEKTILTSPEQPIILVRKKTDGAAARILAPKNNYLGIILAYTPLHYLLFSSALAKEKNITSLVMTSANISDEPLEYDNAQTIKNLRGSCDYFIINNRDIHNRVDDSIVQVINNTPVVLRRARGYAPQPFIMQKEIKQILACGAELKNTFCISKGKYAFLSQYIGDLKTYNTFSFYKETINRFKKLFAITPKIIVCDLHPDYLSTGYAEKLVSQSKVARLAAVQHHQAHIASVIAEHSIKEKIIGVCFDGTGYGEDGRIWGGEFFIGDLKSLKRKAHLEYIPLPGGDKATQEPFRMAISYLYNTFGEGIVSLPVDFVKRHQTGIAQVIAILKNTNPRLTSSVGRLFDSISSLLGIRDIITYEAQAAIELQMLAEKSNTAEKYIFRMSEKNGLITIQVGSVLRGIIHDINKKIPKEIIARKFHNGLAYVTVRICRQLRQKSGINTVVFSGGVFQNKLFSEILTSALKKSGFQVYYNQLLPANDGSISLGQIAIANEIKNVPCHTS